MKYFVSILVLILLLNSPMLSTAHEFKRSEVKKLQLRFMPLSLADYQPRLRGGIEYYIGKSLALTFDIEKGNQKLNERRLNTLNFNQYSFLGYRLGFRYFFFETTSFNRFYLAFEGNWYTAEAQILNNKYIPKTLSDTYVLFDKATWTKHKSGIHFSVGDEFYFKQWLCLNIYAGVGYQNYSQSIDNLENTRYEADVFKKEKALRYAWRNEGDHKGISFLFGLNIGLIVI